MLSIELEDLKLNGFDLELTGFDFAELKLLGADQTVDEQIKEIQDDGNRNLLLIETITEIELQNLFNELVERGYECKIMN
jgi:hypothetical protein